MAYILRRTAYETRALTESELVVIHNNNNIYCVLYALDKVRTRVVYAPPAMVTARRSCFSFRPSIIL
jgi:hypothetical protein